MYSDLWVEMTNKFLRRYAGHFVKGNREQYMDFIDSVLLNMEELQGTGGVSAAHLFEGNAATQKAGSTQHKTDLKAEFMTTLAVVEGANIWGKGGIKPMPTRKGQKERSISADAYVSITGEPMKKEFWDLLATGDERAAWFTDTALTTDGWKSADRQAGKPSIMTLPALKKVINAADRQQWTKDWSTDHVDLCRQDGISIPWIKAEIRKLQLLGAKQEVDSKANKQDLLKTLCKMRETHHEKTGCTVPDEPIDMNVDKQSEADAMRQLSHPLFGGRM